MFKKDITPSARTKVKSSVQRTIRTKVLETYPLLTPYIDHILPKKSQLDSIKFPAERVTLYLLKDETTNGETRPLFWQHMDDPFIPSLRVVHMYPQCFKSLGIDRGAIRFVLSGAALMVPGLTSKGGKLPAGTEDDPDVGKGEVVIIEAEGKQEACLVGMLDAGTKEMREKKKGIAISGGHYLGDGLWRCDFD